MKQSESTVPPLEQKQMTSPLLTKKEVARILQKSPRTVEIWTREGILPCFKLKKAVFYSLSDILTHFRQHYQIGGK
jgi:hypothetical protein